MEPYAKRQRLYAPLNREFPQSFDNEHAYYDEPADTELEDDFDDELQEEEEEIEEEESVSDPDADLQQKRARLDYKLKSTFEAIFEKYGQDFDGVGDEIDLETGDIVVNNGHLLEMQDERDAGDTSRARNLLRDYSDEPDDVPSSSLEETEILDDEDDNEETMSDAEEMIEDDLILRGFARANRFVQASPELGLPRATLPLQKQHRQTTVSRPDMRGNVLPSRTDILAQFGPQLGPQIVNFVSQQRVPDDSHIEPAWRAPELPTFAPVKRPNVKRVILEPEVERSPSPEAVESVWAPIRARGRRRLDGADNDAIFRGESMRPIQPRKPQALHPLRNHSMADLSLPPQMSPPRVKASRQRFTAEDDEILLDWVAKGRAQGTALWSDRFWKDLAAKHPRHGYISWKGRYRNHFTYLWSNEPESSELSPSETSVGTHILEEREAAKARAGAVSQVPVRPPAPERPTRIRKPAQRDSRIVSWSEAVDTIQLLDPVLHAEMLEDTRRMNADDLAFDYPASSNNPGKSFSANRPRAIESRDGYLPPRDPGTAFNEFVDTGDHHQGSLPVESSPLSEESPVRAPCPHADCRSYSTIMYRLQRLDSEDLSEMCLHLFRVHHTTPFPCGEHNCKRKGEEGYFMQADLVKHVKIAHPTTGALQRLRGRVDAELLDRSTQLPRPPTSMDVVPLNDRPVSQARDSDFMYPSKHHNARVTSSSRPFSSSSDQDRTPRGTTGMLGASTSTPMTSVSSLKVNHSSATTVPMREISESHESLMSEEHVEEGNTMSDWAGQVRTEQFNEVATGKHRTAASREPLVQGPALPRNVTGRNALPTPLAATWDSPRHDKDRHFPEGPQLVSSNEPEANTEVHLPRHTTASAPKIASGSNQSPPHNTSRPQTASDEVRASFFTEPRKNTMPKRAPASHAFSRNTVDPSYEFSDEEVGIEPTQKQLPPKPKPASNQVSQLPVEIPAISASMNITLATAQPITKPALVTPVAKPSTKVPPATAQPITKPALVTPVAKPSTKVPPATARPIAKPPLVSPVRKSSTKVPPTHVQPVATPSLVTKSSAKVPPSNVQPVAKPSVQTPANQQKTILQRVLDSDYDELSLGADDFVFMFSRPRTDGRPSSKVQIKREDATNTPQNISSVPARKRRLSMFRAGSDDELCVIGPSPPSQQKLPEIKVEVDDAALPVQQPENPKVGMKKAIGIQPEASSSSQPKHSQTRRKSNNQAAGTNTPLLDLTPSRNKENKVGREIRDSAAEESSPQQASSPNHPRNRTRGQREAAGTSSPLIGLLTPVRKKRWSGDPLKREEVAVVVKTPGGTFRRCGEDGFECGRSFCFRCGEQRSG